VAYFKAADVADDVPVGVPLIGYNNIVDQNHIFSTTAAAGFPAINMGNPATHLKWRGGVSTGDENIIIFTGGILSTIDYLAIAGHNFGSGATLIAVEAADATHLMLHFNGADASTSFPSNNSLGAGHVFTAQGNAQLDTAQYKFGGASLLCDGAGDYASTPASSDFTLADSNFSIDCWIRVVSLAANNGICGQNTDANNSMRFLVANGTGLLLWIGVIGGITIQITQSLGSIAINTWYHVAVVRNNGVITLYQDGIAVASAPDARTYPAFTGLFAIGQDSGSQFLNGWLDEFRFTVGLARWTANFTPPTKESANTTLVNASDDDCQVLLHFDGADGSTTIFDSNSLGTDHTWTAQGNAVIDSAAFKFGGSSLVLDGTGDFVSTPASGDFDLGSGDFTVDLWFNCTATGGSQIWLCGQTNAAGGGNVDSAWFLFRDTSNHISVNVSQGTTQIGVTGTTPFTNLLNTGWHHTALVRTGNVIKLFIDGVQEGSNLAIIGSVNDSSSALCVGSIGAAFTTTDWIGWIDEFRLTVGVARWTTTFTPPTAAAAAGSMITDNKPILFRWTPGVPMGFINLRIRPETAAPEIAVVYAGELLVLERSITIGRGHVPITYGRRTNIVNGMSETGNFLGRIVLCEYRESKAEFEWFTPAFYRSDIDAFLDFAQEAPFFWVWNPEEYPEEVGYVWLTNNAEPETDPVTRRIALTLEMRGIA
jgi:Concanavalin A-like lectin/glucanases superfamily